MKRVTNKTALRIYQRWMTLSADDFTYSYITRGYDKLLDMTKSETSQLKLSWVLEDYKDYQIQKVIKGLENNTQYEAAYLKEVILHLLKSYLREKKLNQLL